MIISVVERQSWKRCRRMWKLTSFTQENLQAISRAPALQLGSMIQDALSTWTEDPQSDPLGAFAQLSIDAVTTAKQRYRERNGAVASDMELEGLYKLIELGVAMITNYRDFYKTPLPAHYHAIQTEQRALVAIPNTEHWTCPECYYDAPMFDGLTHILLECPKCNIELVWGCDWLRGTIDTFVQDDNGRLYALERKTYGQRPEPSKLQHDDQQLAYDWILHKLFPEQATGILYDGLWKRAAPPKTSKSKIEPGQPNTMADLFYRNTFIRPPEELVEFEEYLARECLDMRYALENDLIYINRTWMGCFDCNVSRICDAMSRGEDVEYVVNNFYEKRPEDIPVEIEA